MSWNFLLLCSLAHIVGQRGHWSQLRTQISAPRSQFTQIVTLHRRLPQIHTSLYMSPQNCDAGREHSFCGCRGTQFSDGKFTLEFCAYNLAHFSQLTAEPVITGRVNPYPGLEPRPLSRTRHPTLKPQRLISMLP